MRKKLQIGGFFFDLHFLQLFRRKLYDKGVGKSMIKKEAAHYIRPKQTNELLQ
jgi:hypothetical protein